LDFGRLRYWDVVIIGSGPAGLAAGLTTAHRALTTLIIKAKDQAGGQPQFLYADKQIVDIPGFPDGISGEELSDRTYRQALNALVQFRFNEEFISVEDTNEEGNSFLCSSLGPYMRGGSTGAYSILAITLVSSLSKPFGNETDHPNKEHLKLRY